MSGSHKLKLMVVAVCVAAVAVTGAFVPTANGWTGAGAVASCERLEYGTGVRHWIQITAPKLDPTHNQVIYPNGVWMANPLQWVKYQAYLYRYQQGHWAKIRESPAYWQQVGSGNPESGSWQYWNAGAGRWVVVRGDHPFEIARYSTLYAYRVAVEYEWAPFYANVGSAYVSEQWIPHIDDRMGAYYMSQVDWCVY